MTVHRRQHPAPNRGMRAALTALLALVALEVPAREVTPALGSALAPAMSIQHDTMRPHQAGPILACVLQGNRDASRSVEPGDQFTFELQDGAVAGCSSVELIAADSGFGPGDFECSVTGQRLDITYRGPSRAWPVGAGCCALAEYVAGAGSTVALTSVASGNPGKYLPAEPAAILLSVADRLLPQGPTGPAGPEGPTGSTGPVGPEGPAGTGQRLIVTSTGSVLARQCQPPAPVPGLDVTIDVAEGSNLEVVADLLAHVNACGLVTSDPLNSGHALLELDGTVMAQRLITTGAGGDASSGEAGGSDAITLTWLSDPLVAGSHRVRVLIENAEPCVPPSDGQVKCIGSASDPDRVARLLVFEHRRP